MSKNELSNGKSQGRYIGAIGAVGMLLLGAAVACAIIVWVAPFPPEGYELVPFSQTADSSIQQPKGRNAPPDAAKLLETRQPPEDFRSGDIRLLYRYAALIEYLRWALPIFSLLFFPGLASVGAWYVIHTQTQEREKTHVKIREEVEAFKGEMTKDFSSFKEEVKEDGALAEKRLSEKDEVFEREMTESFSSFKKEVKNDVALAEERLKDQITQRFRRNGRKGTAHSS